ncbi:MAG: cytochrome c biogenesis protein CcsA [Kiritimatiellae bacterium]|nr:cytochrome c biogenesis protein CcsA [Kiritimatiellia bacterium]MDW8457764.1 cytochrome c biogenesis protein CcsA [Verrucomicrobiota bacterium]
MTQIAHFARVVGAASVLLALAAAPAGAQVSDYDAFSRIPVQDGGRIMPMDTYARLRLLQFSGRSTYQGMPAVEWLARLIFDPNAAQTDRVVLVNNSELLEAIGLDHLRGRRFSYAELRPGLEKLGELARAAAEHKSEDRTPLEREFIRVYQNLSAFGALAASFRFALPHPDFAVTNPALRARLGLPPDGTNAHSFLDIYLRAGATAAEVQRLAAVPPEEWSPEESELFTLTSTLFNWNRYYKGLPIALMPVSAHGTEQWVSPWDHLALGRLDEDSRRELVRLQDMARAWLEGRTVDFKLAAQDVARSVRARAQESRGLRYLDLEVLYNRLNPFLRAQMLYGIGFLVSLAALWRGTPAWRRAAIAAVAIAMIPHTLGLIWRMQIMGRPPMTNLYSTFLFVSWACVLLGFVVEWFQRNGLGGFLGAAAGLLLLTVSKRFEIQGDTLGVVIAVLDSNFWLSTHVVAITVGYAGVLAAGIAGHVYLIQALKWPASHPRQRAAQRAIYGLLAFGLIFSFLGTMLGGVWADQSWGRFWGWDPKENGALLIVLWCAILFHARWAGMIGPIGLAAGSVLGIIVVLFAWIGVNLLGVGLHSYGFTTGAAAGLWAAVIAELLFAGVLTPLARRREVAARA